MKIEIFRSSFIRSFCSCSNIETDDFIRFYSSRDNHLASIWKSSIRKHIFFFFDFAYFSNMDQTILFHFQQYEQPIHSHFSQRHCHSKYSKTRFVSANRSLHLRFFCVSLALRILARNVLSSYFSATSASRSSFTFSIAMLLAIIHDLITQIKWSERILSWITHNNNVSWRKKKKNWREDNDSECRRENKRERTKRKIERIFQRRQKHL